MKKNNRKILFQLGLLPLLLLLSCTKTGEVFDDAELPSAKIYLPATGVINIPQTINKNYNLDVVNKMLTVNIGVGRSGLEKREAFNAKLTVNSDTIAKLIQSGVLNNTVEMDVSVYALPSEINVANDQDGETFQITLDLNQASKYVGKKTALAIQISDPSKYEVNPALNTVILVLDYLDLIGKPSFVDDFASRDFTSTYAKINGSLNFEVSNDAPKYDDHDWCLRSGVDPAEIIYSLKSLKGLLPFANKLTGFRINSSAFIKDIEEMLLISYSIDDGKTFAPVTDVKVDKIFIPEKGQNSWNDFYLQQALPANTTDLKIKILSQPADFPNWIPLVRRAEIFYEGGTVYTYQQP